jgi:hypothetical protein
LGGGRGRRAPATLSSKSQPPSLALPISTSACSRPPLFFFHPSIHPSVSFNTSPFSTLHQLYHPTTLILSTTINMRYSFAVAAFAATVLAVPQVYPITQAPSVLPASSAKPVQTISQISDGQIQAPVATPSAAKPTPAASVPAVSAPVVVVPSGKSILMS